MIKIESKFIKYYHREVEVFIPVSSEHLKCSIIKKVYNNKVWEKKISNMIFNDTLKNTIAIDIGANIGIHSVSMMDAVGRDGHVVAFEPQPEISICLDNTLKTIGTNYTLSSKLVSNTNCIKMFYSDGTGRSRIPIHGDRYVKKWTKTLIDTTCLDTFMNNLEIKLPVSLLKIDVEGHEFEVLEGAKHLIKINRPIIYIEIWKDRGDYDRLVTWCSINKYNITKISPNDYRLTSY